MLRTELAGTGVRSVLVEPGPVDTGAWDVFEHRLGQDLPPRSSMLKAETVAEAVLGVLRSGSRDGGTEVPVLPA